MMNSTQLLFFFIFPLSLFISELAAAQNTTIPFNVGVILDFNTTVGKMGMNCISMALEDFYATHNSYKTRLVLHTRDSKKDTVRAASMALDLLKNIEVQAIIGPQTSAQANFVVDLGDKAQVPIVSFSATSPLPWTRTPYFIRASQSEVSHVKAITAIVQAFEWRKAITIYEDTDYGNGIIPYLINAFQEIDIHVPYQSVLTPSATDDQILKEIYKLMTMQPRVFILHMSPSLGSRFFLKAKEAGMMSEGYAWIITDGLANFLNYMDPYVIDSMQGVLGVRPHVPKSKALDDFKVRWRKKFQHEYADGERADLNILGLWAYDIVWALAKAAENVRGEKSHFQQMEPSENSTDLATLGESQTGPKLLQTIMKTKFKGLSGDFSLDNGQLQSSVVQILNVIGNNRGRQIGFWTPKNGILRELNVNSTRTYSTSKANLRAIIWPRESTIVPKGWVIPLSGKKMRIGVPVKEGFTEFVSVSRDPKTNRTTVTGYCIDVFKATMEALPYAVPYEFIPFEDADGKSAGDYNDMVYQVHLQNFDAVVGDVTITANRSLYADFTLPYTESGVSMFVPIKRNDSENFWVFLKPLSLGLWLTIGAFFIFTGFVIWALEHRINDDFRGPPGRQLGTVFWFSFSTLVFAHKEKVVSNLARFIMIIWVFVVLILTSSYTASLTSILTVQQLEPTATDVKELLKNGESVGYTKGSYVLGLLKQLNFTESQLKVYNSVEECDEMLSKGSKNGGIAAIIDDIPCIKLLVAKYCAKYAMVGPIFKFGGWGFVFPKGSPLLHDVSSALLHVTEGEKMEEIHKAWFGSQTNCPDPNTKASSKSLNVKSFWGLFLIAGVSSSIALFMFSINFCYEHAHILTDINPETSIWKRIVTMARHFDQKDHSSHNFRNTEYGYRNNIDSISIQALPLPNPNAPSSPLNISNHTVGNVRTLDLQC